MRGSGLRSRRLAFVHLVGLAIIGLQVCSIVYARFIPQRFFCWAPYDLHTYYRIEVVIDGVSLSSQAILGRYRYHAEEWEHRSIHNVFDFIQDYERSYGAGDDARVTVEYATNGRPSERWHYP